MRFHEAIRNPPDEKRFIPRDDHVLAALVVQSREQGCQPVRACIDHP